jgi:hypothetical protein
MPLANDPVESFVASHAPRTFALVEEGDGQEVEILGWGFDAGDGAYVVGYDGALRGTFSSAGDAERLLSVRVVWLR